MMTAPRSLDHLHNNHTSSISLFAMFLVRISSLEHPIFVLEIPKKVSTLPLRLSQSIVAASKQMASHARGLT
jgi:hypothetical protein